MTSKRSRAKKHFTIEEANAALPLVRAIAKDLARLSEELIERKERLSLLCGDRDPEASDLYSEELRKTEEGLEADTVRLEGYIDELRELGVEPKNGPVGLVDFPSLMDGREVYLCWKLDEPEVLYWHEVDAGFPGRQPLTAASMADDDAPSGGESGEE